jgi:hypothetical protein
MWYGGDILYNLTKDLKYKLKFISVFVSIIWNVIKMTFRFCSLCLHSPSHLKTMEVMGIIIIARTDFCQSQFKLGLTEPSSAVDINPAGFLLVCIFNKNPYQLKLKNPYQLKFQKIDGRSGYVQFVSFLYIERHILDRTKFRDEITISA